MRKAPTRPRKNVEFAFANSYANSDRLGLSATTFLMLCMWLGPDRAVFLLTAVAIAAAWVALCKRFPTVGFLTGAFFNGLLGGLFRQPALVLRPRLWLAGPRHREQRPVNGLPWGLQRGKAGNDKRLAE